MADMIKIKSTTDTTISLYDPTIPVNKVLEKKNAIAMIEKDKLIQLYFNSELEAAMRAGLLVIEDKNFLLEVGYLIDENEQEEKIDLTPAFMKRCISAMPVSELEITLRKMSNYQIQELAEYAIQNSQDLRMDRLDLLGKYSGKNILKAIELLKADREG